ncbi:ribonuclease H-like domain-containing protein [Rhizophagus clarus]|uniref:Ribonuclease H-like domain-containing protein n=1 Tax=Rhizophagus clarus TaxID=94130 RepID=A0A8H3QQ77_9GLOM|nr:ribonuclease H-like domain-containing protein [Rhizophagus clarus]
MKYLRSCNSTNYFIRNTIKYLRSYNSTNYFTCNAIKYLRSCNATEHFFCNISKYIQSCNATENFAHNISKYLRSCNVIEYFACENIKSTFVSALQNLSIHTKLRQLIIKIQHSSQRLEKLSANCRLYNIDDLKPIQDALTFTAASDKNLKNCVITDDNWNQLELIKGFLELFKEITVIMSGSKYSTLSTTIPLYNELITYTEEYLESEELTISNDFLKKTVEDCNRKLLEYYNKTNKFKDGSANNF